MAVYDVVRSEKPRGIHALEETLVPDLRNGRFSMVILDNVYGHLLAAHLEGYRLRQPGPFTDPEALRPVVGLVTSPTLVYERVE